MIYGKDKKDIEPYFKYADYFIGSMLPAFHPCFVWAKLKGMKTLRRWVGTDVYKLRFWHYRIQARLCNLFVNKHCFVTEQLKQEFKQVFPKRKVLSPLYPAILPTYENRFNVMVYLPKLKRHGFGVTNDYIYGKDYIDRLMKIFPEFNWLIMDRGYSQNVVDELYKVTNILLRPTRHDGNPRMIMRAREFNVTYIWGGGYETPFIEAYKILEKESKKWQVKKKL